MHVDFKMIEKYDHFNSNKVIPPPLFRFEVDLYSQLTACPYPILLAFFPTCKQTKLESHWTAFITIIKVPG